MSWGLPWPGNELAKQAEEAGAAAFCAGEFADLDAYVTSTEMALGTSTAQIGPGIAYAFARSPFVHASAIRHLSRLSQGRMFLALGAGTPRMNSDWFSVDASKPAARMADLVGAIRAYITAENGSTVSYESDHYTIQAKIMAPVLGNLEVPLLLGAFNSLMVRTVGRCADGLLGHGLFTDRWWDEVIDPELARGASEAGRDLSAIRRWGWVITAIDDEDPDRAVREAKQQIAFYLTVKAYDRLVELHGWQDEVEKIRIAFRTGDNEGLVAAVTDEMLHAIAVCGSTDQAASMLKARAQLPELAFLAPPSFLVGRRRRAALDTSAITFAATHLS